MAGAVRRVAGFAGAAAMVPYAVIKTSWVVGALAGVLPAGEGFGTAGWVVLNAVTVGMAAAGIGLSLALTRPAWSARFPVWLLLLFAWIGAGFLVPMLPYSVVAALLGADPDDPPADGGGDGSPMPGWEGALIGVGFGGLAIGLAVALPIHLRERWPDAFHGRVRLPGTGGDSRTGCKSRPAGTAVTAVAASAAVAAADLYWAAGGSLGIVRPEHREPAWRLMTGNSGLWALLGCVSVLVLAGGRRAGRLPVVLPISAAWIASGSLFAWGAWKLPFAAYLASRADGEVPWPEDLAVVAARDAVALVAGAAVLSVVLSAHRSRRAARPAGG
ncbi:hypothetical protein [Kitasatospora camelliae]|uniref:Uncharacterized protein n=1 Tax=Kitasatospora camelliae TaxID=3156397 RepID=A0AAU8K0X4_9ACTN